MSTTVKTGWLHDKNGDKFAPKTLTSQVQTSDGTLLEDKIQTDIETAILNHNHNDMYYTEEEVDTLLVGKADANHDHGAEWMATKEYGGGGATEWEASLVFTTSASIMLSTKFYPNIGMNYDVYWNGVKYTCTAFEQSGELFLGNRELISDDTPNIPTSAPFCFFGWALSGSTPVLNGVKKETNDAETISVKITTEELIHYNILPDEYLSDNIARISDIDERVISLIDERLGVIENGSY